MTNTLHAGSEVAEDEIVLAERNFVVGKLISEIGRRIKGALNDDAIKGMIQGGGTAIIRAPRDTATNAEADEDSYKLANTMLAAGGNDLDGYLEGLRRVIDSSLSEAGIDLRDMHIAVAINDQREVDTQEKYVVMMHKALGRLLPDEDKKGKKKKS